MQSKIVSASNGYSRVRSKSGYQLVVDHLSITKHSQARSIYLRYVDLRFTFTQEPIRLSSDTAVYLHHPQRIVLTGSSSLRVT
jgi:hypothetical protein